MVELPPRTGNFLDDSKAWGNLLGALPEGEPKDAVGKMAVNELAGRNTLFGCSRIFVRSGSAYAVPDSLDGKGGQQAVELNDVALLGGLGLADYILLEGSGTLTWRVYDSQTVEKHEVALDEDVFAANSIGLYMPTDRPSRAPIHLPVDSIELALPVTASMWEHIRAA